MVSDLYTRAYMILCELYGENAAFREGQFEAIRATLTHHRTLVVQKTGSVQSFCAMPEAVLHSLSVRCWR